MRRQIDADLAAVWTRQSDGPSTQAPQTENQFSQTGVASEDTDETFLPLCTECPMISQTYLRQIAKDKFDLDNLPKLCTDVVLTKTATKTINLVKDNEIQTGEEDASVSELRGLPKSGPLLKSILANQIPFGATIVETFSMQSFFDLPRPTGVVVPDAYMGVAARSSLHFRQIQDIPRHRRSGQIEASRFIFRTCTFDTARDKTLYQNNTAARTTRTAPSRLLAADIKQICLIL